MRTVIAVILAGALGCGGCGARGGATASGPPTQLVTRLAGSTALWRSPAVVVGWHPTGLADEPGPITMVAPAGDATRTLTGWVAGAVDAAAIVIVREADQLVVQRVDLTGDPVVIGAVPRPARLSRLRAAVTGTGAVAVWMHVELDLDSDPQAPRQPDTITIVDAAGVRPLAARGNAGLIAAEPAGPGVLVTDDSGLALVDAATGAARWRRALPLEHAVFAGDRLIGIGADEVVQLDPETGTIATRWAFSTAHRRTVAIDPTGARVAYSVDVGGGEGAWSDPACHVYLRTATSDDMIQRWPGGCYSGVGLLWVDGVLWIAPPEARAP